MGLFSTKKQVQSSSHSQGHAKLRAHGRYTGRDQHCPATNPSPGPFHPPETTPPPLPPRDWNYTCPAGLLAAGPPAPVPYHGQESRHYPPVIMNQHYYLAAPCSYPHTSNVYPFRGGDYGASKLKLGSTSDLVQLPANAVNQFVDDGLSRWHVSGTQFINQGAALCDQISSKFDDVMTLIDRDKFAGDESDLFTYQPHHHASSSQSTDVAHRSAISKSGWVRKKSRDPPKGETGAGAASLITGGYFAKVHLYANSRLPPDLPPFRTHLPTYHLLCLAAQYAERVYKKPQGEERDAHVEADWRTGTKAMYIKSVPMDSMGAIVFAIRGTATFMDWAVNLNTAPAAPTGFLDDAGNFCHAGFLSVARKMVAPVAARLRQLLEEDPGRCAHSLLITGHSAGGAIASLLYMHMLAASEGASSELNLLTGCFRRIHCVTFGSPPVSLFPLRTPRKYELEKSLFYSFVNEGDPVTRADKAYVKSLLELFAAPAPPLPATTVVKPTRSTTKSLVSTAETHSPKSRSRPQEKEKEKKKKKTAESALATKPSQSPRSDTSSTRQANERANTVAGPIWRVPPSTLSNAGRIVVLRSGSPRAAGVKRAKTVEERVGEGVVAQLASDEKLRGVVWGDPVCHVMRLYAARIEALAVAAITARGL